ncbi:MAG: class I SAM-dependent methyltransferase [Candidatus Eisenbacteria bacterium]|nr:class I SAM-dependent methyltransferase [Candidatus Eisenbacteria bacterium]
MNKSIQKMFEPLARRYELLNHIMTFGMDTLWRKEALRIAAENVAAGTPADPHADLNTGPNADLNTDLNATPSPGAGFSSVPAPELGLGVTPEHGRGLARRIWLDVSTGTGEMADMLSRRAGSGTTVLAADFSIQMLRVAARKKSARAGRMLVLAADDGRLPFRDASVDLVTISVGTRNLNSSRDALLSCFREFCRVLRPGGRFVNLETSQPRARVVRWLFHAYVNWLVRPVASALSGHRPAYSYLAASMCGFYDAEELATIIREAGFSRVKVAPVLLGIAAIHVAHK